MSELTPLISSINNSNVQIEIKDENENKSEIEKRREEDLKWQGRDKEILILFGILILLAPLIIFILWITGNLKRER